MAEQSSPSTTPPPAKKAGRGKLIIVLAVTAVLVLGGGLAAFWATRQPARAAEKPGPPKSGSGGIVSFEPLVVNLADSGGGRFLRVSIRLVVEQQEQAERIQKSDVMLTRLRSAIIDILTEQTADHLVTPDGKSALKKAIVERSAALLAPEAVSDVLFSDFVVQF